jgi:hypothetical protein
MTPSQNEANFKNMLATTDLVALGRKIVDNIQDSVFVYDLLIAEAAAYNVTTTYMTVNEWGNYELIGDQLKRAAVWALVKRYS